MGEIGVMVLKKSWSALNHVYQSTRLQRTCGMSLEVVQTRCRGPKVVARLIGIARVLISYEAPLIPAMLLLQPEPWVRWFIDIIIL